MHALGHALQVAGSMAWQMLWALILGFALSGIIQAVVRKSTITRLMGDSRPRTITVAAGLGAASSSCSYAAVALARSLFRKGANFVAAMAFEIGSTNLVIELGVILALLLGWQFTLAEFVGGPVMIIGVALLFRFFVRNSLIEQAGEQAERGLAGSMEGHAAMDMSVDSGGSFRSRLLSAKGWRAVSNIFVMEWAAIFRDLVIGLLIAGAIGAWVPQAFWSHVFLAGHPTLGAIQGPLVGPLVAIGSFVCSVGNVPLAAVLWNGGISFGGVVAFLLADLLIIPILNIYRKYYGWRMALVLLGTFYAAMVVAGYLVEVLFGITALTPQHRHFDVLERGVSWNYTTWLNIVSLVLAAAMVFTFLRTGGRSMLAMMGGAPSDQEAAGGGKH